MDFSWFLSQKDIDPKYRTRAEQYHGQKVAEARSLMIDDLKADGLLLKIDEQYTHRVGTCYRCGSVLEPLPIPQWYIKTKSLAQPAIKAVKDEKTKIFPQKRFKKMYFDWLNNVLDWNISRQVVWGPRIPIWYCLDCHPSITLSFLGKDGQKKSGTYKELSSSYSFAEINAGLQTLSAPLDAHYSLNGEACTTCKGTHLLQETDTFDTWFLSSQWPITTLGFPNNDDFNYFYPTSVLDTMWDILFFWVARMMMMGIYRTGKVPFEVIHLHSRVVDGKGQKMSKSKGNVINPLVMVDTYGADALRMALIFGAAPGSDIALSEDKVRGMRNFANKLWNIGRFINLNQQALPASVSLPVYNTNLHQKLTNAHDKRIISELHMMTAAVTKYLEAYRFSDAAKRIYSFTWHRLADVHLEKNKDRFKNGDPMALAVLIYVFEEILKLLHPFMPFVTESLWKERAQKTPLIVTPWPSR
jgi:valyl-tRNA synthetase